MKSERPVPSILLDAEKLHDLLIRAEPMMSATDRRRYGERAIGRLEDVIAEFVLAYDFEDERYEHLKKMWAHIAILIRLIRRIGEHGAIRQSLKHEPMSPEQMKLAILERVASLDKGATKWKNSVTKKVKVGKTQGQDPQQEG